ncbi:hypothetical protein HYU94_00990 [Candidatus Daviesbacteria bacterium]|nr:hypothetical protein [Candidatus Daviesbacteria bacterium]
MINVETHLPNPEAIKRYDGSSWRAFHTPDGTHLIVTQRGLELLKFNPALRKAILNYRDDANPFSHSTTGARTYFKAGGNGDVYNLDSYPILIKESFSQHSLWSALDRMDHLHGICIRYLPPSIRVPDQYGVLFSRKSPKEYLMMQKINEGLTVADIINGYSVGKSLREVILREFSTLREKVEAAIKVKDGDSGIYSNLLPDWDAGNILVDLGTKTKDYPFTFWIIDQ